MIDKSIGAGPVSPDRQAVRLARILQTIQLATAVLVAPIVYLIGLRVSYQAGWENGIIEMVQNLVIGFAAIASVAMGLVRRQAAQRWFWFAVALVWLVLLGRELSWGAVLGAPLQFDAYCGPFYSYRNLVYKPMVPYAVSAVLLVAVVLMVRAEPVKLFRLAWQRRGLAPFGALLACLLYALIGTVVEQSGALGCAENGQVLEEAFEAGTYYFLLRAQWWTFARWLKPQPSPGGAPRPQR